MNTLNYRTYQDLSRCIRNGIKKFQHGFDLVVGIPRSGMIPAYMLGLMMNCAVCSIDEFLKNITPSNGERPLRVKSNGMIRVLIVDDSIHSGISYTKTKERVSKANLNGVEIEWLAIYAREETKDIPDYYFEIVPCPRAFQWNYLHSTHVQKSCFDIDGVLCVDPDEEQNDDGEKYIDFLLHASPLFIPKYKIHTIVTSRLEKYRVQTEKWLKDHGVLYENLIMLNLCSKQERIRLKAHATFKAQVYASLKDTYIFYESDRNQALQISALTKKPCFCVATDELFYGYEHIFESASNLLFDIPNIYGKKVLLYTHELTYTGAPHSLLRICNILLKNGCSVEVWSPIDGPFSKEFKSIGVNLRIVENPALNSSKYIQLISFFDIAIANTVLSHRFYLIASGLIPTIWFIREALNLPNMVNAVPDRYLALKKAPLLYCVSELAAQFINVNYNTNTKILHNCVEDYYIGDNVELEEVCSGIIHFAIVGNFKYNKGFDLCVEAFKQLPSSLQKQAHLHLIGRLPKSDESYWNGILNSIQDVQNITYEGEFMDTEKKISFFRKIDVFIIASRSESCSLVALESAMLGKPIILNENVGAKYIVSKENGWIFKSDDVTSLKTAIESAIINKDKLGLMGLNSRKKYLRTSTIDIYEKNIVSMVAEYASGTKYENVQNNSVASLEMQKEILQKEIDQIYGSWTYKIGRFITFFPKKIIGGIRCYQEHGLHYTLRRCKEKVLSRFRRGK